MNLTKLRPEFIKTLESEVKNARHLSSVRSKRSPGAVATGDGEGVVKGRGIVKAPCKSTPALTRCSSCAMA